MSNAPFTIGFEEGLLTIKELAEVPEIQLARLKYSRIRKWAFVGINGKKLPTVMIGGIRYSTVERVLQFATQCGLRESVDSQDIRLTETISTTAKTTHKRLAERLYGKKSSRSKN